MKRDIQPRSLADPDCWDYEDHFAPVEYSGMHSVVGRVEQHIASVDLANHPFFEAAAASSEVLKLWMSQELVMTNAFSQIVLAAASRTPNVHVRAVLAEVAYGEHGRSKAGLASKSHPWLLHLMGRSVGLSGADVRPAKPTRRLIDQLESKSLESTLSALAWIGVGNERLIAPEYEAIEKCFARVLAEADYKPFLRANVSEDVLHSRLCFEAASMLVRSDEDAETYFEEAAASVDARVSYFDELCLLSADVK